MRGATRIGAGVAAILVAATAAGSATAVPASTSIFVDTAAWPTIAISVVLPGSSTARPVLFENGFHVRIVGASNVGRADAVAVAVDHSQSMRGAALRTAVGVAKALVSDRTRGDRMGVFAIASRATQLAPFSRTPGAGERALAKVRVDKRYGTALYDGVVLAADKLGHVPGKRRVIFLLTDGQGTTGTADIEQAAAAASAADVSVYPVMIDSATYLPRSLRELSRATHGAFLGAETRSGSTDYAAIASDVRRTWRIVYTTKATAGSTITLKVQQPGGGTVTTSAKIPGKAPGKPLLRGHGWSVVAILVILGAFLLVLVIARKPTPRD
jgi:von Willebrand factor type A domain